MRRRAWLALPALLAGLLATGCYGYRHAIQWDSRVQIWAAEASQVKVRAAQTQVFDTRDRIAVLEAIVGTFQDLGFQVEVLDEELGIVSGKKYLARERPAAGVDPTYQLYEEGTSSSSPAPTGPGARSGAAATWCASP